MSATCDLKLRIYFLYNLVENEIRNTVRVNLVLGFQQHFFSVFLFQSER